MRAVMLAQVEYCEAQQAFFKSSGKKCRVSTFMQRGSAFIFGSSKTLWTASHVLKDGFAPKDVSPVFVLDSQGKFINNPYVDVPVINQGGPDSSDPTKDYAKLVYTKELGTPLQLAPDGPKEREELFAIGFPSCTNCQNENEPMIDRQARKTGPDSPGNDQRVSRGRPYRRWLTPLVNTTVDLIPGNSGGPGVNAQGQVFGLAILSAAKLVGDKSPRLGTFVIPPEWRL